MSDFYIQNSYRFFVDKDLDIHGLLELVERYDKPECFEMQKEAISMLSIISLSEELRTWKLVPGQFEAWHELRNIIDGWTDAWIEIISNNPHKITFCNNEIVWNYYKLIR